MNSEVALKILFGMILSIIGMFVGMIAGAIIVPMKVLNKEEISGDIFSKGNFDKI